MFKKVLSILALGAVMVSTMPQAKEITVYSVNKDATPGEVTLKMYPKRIAALDYAAIDTLTYLGEQDRIVATPKNRTVTHVKKTTDRKHIKEVGTAKVIDFERLMETQPDLIIIGNRLTPYMDQLQEIAPVLNLKIDYSEPYLVNLEKNASSIAKLFNKKRMITKRIKQFDRRIQKLNRKFHDREAVIGLVTSNNIYTMGNKSKGSMIGSTVGFKNVATKVDSAHGNESNFELLVKLDPEYLFIIDRDYAIATKGAKLAKDLLDNDLVKKTRAYKKDKIIYLNPSVWYLCEGGMLSTDIMLKDLENGLKNKR